ncbi:MAG: type I-C CRISPR-associated endonuclease Cas1c [Thermomicrobiales bacterium]
MHHLLNTLYVMTQGTYAHLDHDTVRLEVERETVLRVPLLQLSGIVCFGNTLISPMLMHRCAEDGRAVVLLDRNGRFKARVEGPVSGNVLLRQAQYLALTTDSRALDIARCFVAAKLQNARQVLLRAAREAVQPDDVAFLGAATREIADGLAAAAECRDLDTLRGCEGNAARAYFGVFDRMIRDDRETFALRGRTRRPPLDRTNAALSFCYTLVLADCVAAVAGVGLDPQVGFLHALRPGRPALGLDLLEELRASVADRLVLTLLNRRQLQRDDFEEQPGGAVYLSESGRRTVVIAYQERKKEEVPHRLLGKKIPLGLVPHVQARLLARHLRGDLEHYPAFMIR